MAFWDRQWFRDIPFQRKTISGLGVFVLLQILAALVFVVIQAEVDKATDRITHTYKVIDTINRMIAAERAQFGALGSYPINTSNTVLGYYTQSRDEFSHELHEMEGLTQDDPVQQSRLNRLRETFVSFQNDYADPQTDAALMEPAPQRASKLASLDSRASHFVDEFEEQLTTLRQAEEQLLSERENTRAHYQRIGLAAMMSLAVFGVIICIIAMMMTSGLIVRPLVHLTNVVQQLARRELGVDIRHQNRKDELGVLARAIEFFREASREAVSEAWIKSSVATVSGKLQSAATLPEFAEILTSELASLIGIGVGVFYFHSEESDQLELAGSYGFKRRKHVSPIYKIGEGLVGQCARERKSIILDNPPDDYIRIHSGLGESSPDTIVLLPIVYHSRLLGVLELGSFGALGPQQQKFLEELTPIVSLSLDNLERAQRTQELLEKSQRQAEALRLSEGELKTKQDELQKINQDLNWNAVELEQRTARLQASEEELRVQAEELQATNEELREKSEALNEQNRLLEILRKETEEKAEELARASQYKSEFLANMSHELRTPLNSLLILSRGLADNEDGHLSGEEVESARVIHESGSNLLRLINDILDLSKVESGKMDIMLDELRLQAFADRLMRNFRHVAKEKGLEYVVEIDAGLPEIIGTDGAKLEQVANNLLGNAFKFTRQGSVRVQIGRPTVAQLTGIPGLDTAKAVAIRVSDTGVGIPKDKFEKVFQAFEQVDASTSRQFGGTGLGLTISRSLAKLLGGDILLESEEGRGTTFTIVLPERLGVAAAMSAPAAGPATAPPAPVPPSATSSIALTQTSIPDDRAQIQQGDTVILIVEDDPAFARILADMVRRKGFRMLAAADGESGLALALQYRPTGVLLDVMLPGMDGWTVIDRLKADPSTRHIPVHFISATDQHSRGLELGAVGFLTKPVSRDDINHAFERLLHFSEGKPRHVLIVDDDAGSRMAVRKLVSAEGTSVDEASNGEEALTHLREAEYDCVILDLGLPGMDGFQFLDKASQAGRVPPVVVYSGRELSKEESLRLRQYTDSIVIKGARSPERLLDEVSLFLHSIRSAPAVPVRELDESLSGRSVLVVDDDMRNVFALSKALRSKGLNVVMAQDGQKALRQLTENNKIELVLMDIMMPGMDGYETMREIRRQPQFAKLPMIALTAKAMRGDREKCLEAGANDYLSKPIDIDKLLSMMRVWLSG